MNTSDAPTGLNRPVGLPRQRRLLTATIALLGVALAAAAWVQVRQYRLLNATTQYQEDYLQVSLHELQAEYLRLRYAIHEAGGNGVKDRNALQMRYDIFVSRVELLASPRAGRLIPDMREFQDVAARTRAFVASADRALGPTPSAALNTATLQALDRELLSLDGPIHSLALEASHNIAAQVALRNAVVANYNRVGLGLSALLLVTTIGFALLAMGQLRRLDERRLSLERLATALRQAQHEAEAANRAKGNFLANMSHEIRTPFQGLLGMLQLLDTGALAPAQRSQLNTARDSAEHLLAILNDVLDMSRLEAGTLSVGSEALNLRGLVGDVQRLMQGQAAAKGLVLQHSVDAALPEWVLLDATRVRQVIFNLLSNAIKFTDRGGITLEVRASASQSGGEIVFAVIDSGIGIDEATLPRLFKRFGQGDDSRSRRYGGAGLGLEISRNLARLMGGDLTVQSTPGQGSRFEMRLPLRVAAAAPASAVAAPPLPVPAGARAPGRALRVLAAEDNPVNREVLAAMIEVGGHQVSFAENGVEALRAVRSQSFDLVLMDLHMPELDGIGATRAIRALGGAAAKLPIVALTADAFAETRARCLDAGMDEFLSKPVGLAELTQLLARHAALAA